MKQIHVLYDNDREQVVVLSLDSELLPKPAHILGCCQAYELDHIVAFINQGVEDVEIKYVEVTPFGTD